MKYIFSVIIPIYNLDKYLKESIDCIIDQTIGFKENIQLILIDDGSTDYSSRICESYVSLYPDNISYVYQKNQGASAARNAGIEYVQGKYLVFFDGDDLWEKDAFMKVRDYFDEHYDEIDVVACRIKRFEKYNDYANLDYRFNQGTRIVDITKTPWIIHPNVSSSIIKTSAIGELRFDTRLQFGEDAKFLAVLIAQKGRFALLKEVQYFYRKRFEGTSLTQSASNDVKRHLNTSEYYYKGLYKYSINTYGKVLPYFQYLIMNALKTRVVTPGPKLLSEKQLEKYRRNLRWVVKHTSDRVILRMNQAMRNTRLYMLWLKYGDAFYDNLTFKDGTFHYKGIAVGRKLPNRDVLRVDDINIDSGKKVFYGAVQLSVFLPQPQLFAHIEGEYVPVELTESIERSKKSFQDDQLYHIYTWMIETKQEAEFPECIIRIGDYEMSLIPSFQAEQKLTENAAPSYSDEECVKKISEIIGEAYEDLMKHMQTICKSMGITFNDYYHYGLYNLTDPQKSRTSKILTGRRNRTENLYKEIVSATGFSEKEVDARITWINKRNLYKVTLSNYSKYELYKYSGIQLDEKLKLLAERDMLKDELQQQFVLIDDGKIDYNSIRDKLSDIYMVYDKLIPESLIELYADRLRISLPDIYNDSKKLRRISADIEFSLQVLGFNLSEYICFRFAEKTLEEKREFISERQLMKVYDDISTDSAYDILSDKYNTFGLLKKYYRRNMIKISGKDDREKFLRFCSGKDMFVFKPVYGGMGKGIRPIYLNEYKNLEDLFNQLTGEYGEWIAEEMILQHQATRALNLDSVNTVRMITYFDGRKIIIHRAFAKIGRGGSFVDNGGSGGIFVTIDHNTGFFTTDGCDENGVVYKKHPETGVHFKGYKMPKWRKALRLAKKIAKKVPEAKYIGWDLAFTKDRKWVLVEGNSKTQFIGQQCTTGHGEKKLLLDLIYN